MKKYDGTIVIGTEVDSKGFDNGVSGLEKSVSKFGNSISSSLKMLTGLTLLNSIGDILNIIVENFDEAASRLDTMKNYTKVMSNLGIANKDAEASINRLSDALMGLPTTLDDAALSVQRLTSVNGNVKASTEIFLAMNNAIIAGGANAQTQATAIEQLSQAYAKGKPDMMEWRTLMTAMPAQLKQVAMAMNLPSADALGQSLRNGTISMNDFMLTIVKLNQEGVAGFQSFEQQARNATGGIQVSITNAKTAIVRGVANILEAIGRTNIAGFITGIGKAISTVLTYIAAFIKYLAIAIRYVSKLFSFGGKKRAKDTSKATADTVSSMVDLGGAGVAASDGLDKATGSAKKLNKELKTLSSFDEMNVLKEASDAAESAGLGGLSGGVGGALGLDDMDLSVFDDLEDSISATDKAMKNIKEFIFGKGTMKEQLNTLMAFNKYVADQERKILRKLWGDLEPFFKSIKEETRFLWEPMVVAGRNAVETKIKPMMWGIKSEFEKIIEATRPAWQPLANEFETKVINPVKNQITNLKTWFYSRFGTFINTIIDQLNKYIFEPLGFHLKHIQEDFTQTGGAAKKSIDNVKSSLDNMVKQTYKPKIDTSSLETTKNSISALGSNLANMTRRVFSINATLDLDANTTKAGSKIMSLFKSIFGNIRLPKLAVGGIVNMPGRGVPVGGALTGERGAEGVIPLTDSQQMALLGEAIGRYITVNASITNTMNGRVISRELQKVQNNSDFAYNR